MIDKNGYNNIDIPTNLSSVVQDAIEEGLNQKTIVKKISFPKRAVSVAAVFVLCFATLLNTSLAFAAAAYKIPVIGDLFRIITFREYHFEDDIQYIDAKIPKIDNTGKTELEKRVNLEIQKTINHLLQDDTVRAKEYYDAFIETGGIPEEYIPLGITMDYEIKCVDSRYVSFVISHYETKFQAYNKQYFYNIDMETGRIVSLKDWLGTEYKQIVADSIEKEISLWNEEKKAELWEDLEFTNLITENTDFYIDQNGYAVVVFPKYEIAAGSAGALEFTILTEDR